MKNGAHEGFNRKEYAPKDNPVMHTYKEGDEYKTACGKQGEIVTRSEFDSLPLIEKCESCVRIVDGFFQINERVEL